MRFRFSLFSTLALAVLLTCGDFSTSRAAEEEGFVSLFNGKDLEGWIVKGKPEGWEIKDGLLRSEGGKGGDRLQSKKEYGDYLLKLEWKVSKGGNSGVFIRAKEEGNPWVTGYEVQIYTGERDDLHCTGSLYGYAAVNPRPDETPDKWHTMDIQCVGPQIKIVCDGVKVVDVDQSKLPLPKEAGYPDPKTKPLKGYIGLQDSHSAAGHYIEYRNVRIKELK